jgi:hypothetical protein
MFEPRIEAVGMAKRYDEQVAVERDAGMPAAFLWRGRRFEVRDVIGRWRIEGRWWEDGRDREYWRVEAKGGAVVDLYQDRAGDTWHLERLWD